MATHFEDEEQLENLKHWWNDNWKSLVAGLVIGFGAIGGWQGWKAYSSNQAVAASQMYEDFRKAVTDARADDARKISDKLRSDYARTPYAAAAELQMAQVSVQNKQLDDAVAHLAWVADKARDPGLRQLAKLRQARVLWDQGKSDDALKLLSGDAGVYESLYQELRGDIAFTKGDHQAARQAYEAALKSAAEDAANRVLLQQKLDDLAPATAEPVKS